MNINLTKDPIGQTPDGKDVFLKDIWPTNEEVFSTMATCMDRAMFQARYADVYMGDAHWQAINVTGSETYQWRAGSTYVANPPYFEGMTMTPAPVQDIIDAKPLLILGDSITTDHISPAGNIKADSPKLELVRKAQETGEPIPWVKVHKAPDYVYFNHSAHLNRGISCQSCHGKVNEMEVVKHAEPQSMGWCLDCHRNPEQNLRPLDQITNLNYKPGDLDRAAFYQSLLGKGVKADEIAATIQEDGKASSLDEILALASSTYGKNVTQLEVGSQLKKHWQVMPPENCTACHR